MGKMPPSARIMTTRSPKIDTTHKSTMPTMTKITAHEMLKYVLRRRVLKYGTGNPVSGEGTCFTLGWLLNSGRVTSSCSKSGV